MHLEPVTRDNWRAVIALDIADHQRGFIKEPSLLYVVAESQFYPAYSPHAIYAGDIVVGFVTFGPLSDDPTAWWIPLLIIDRCHQRKGYGRRALELLIDHVQGIAPGCRVVGLSYRPANGAAAGLYAELGFDVEDSAGETGEVTAWLRFGSPNAPNQASRRVDCSAGREHCG